ncbi:hypothetical protein B0H13DRAFT_1869729 [Mycena leptocephala]|nr:hypothetical protein B0H13DRAFT_1869729 [Mycena leptocephala]
MAENQTVLEEARNAVRRVLRSQNPADFPLGPRGITLDALFIGVTVTYCQECGHTLPGVTHTFGQYQNVFHSNTLRQTYPNEPTLSQWLQYHFDCRVQRRSNGIQRKMRRLTTIHDISPILIITINLNNLVLDQEPNFGNGNTLKLRGLIYHSPPVDLPVCGGELVGAASRLLRLAQMGACGWGQPSRTAYGQTFAVVKLREEAEQKNKRPRRGAGGWARKPLRRGPKQPARRVFAVRGERRDALARQTTATFAVVCRGACRFGPSLYKKTRILFFRSSIKDSLSTMMG